MKTELWERTERLRTEDRAMGEDVKKAPPSGALGD